MKIKILSAISLLVFFVFTTFIFAAGIVAFAREKDGKEESLRDQKSKISLADASATGDPAVSDALTEELIAKHNSQSDCWVIIDGNVYDLTSFIPQHPGGGNLIASYCGGDATVAFNTRDKKPSESHSSFAKSLLRSYYVGPLGRQPANIAFPDPNNPNAVKTVPFPNNNPVRLSIPTPTLGAGGAGSSSITVDSTEVSRHSSLQNCWMIISGNVYDISGFTVSHPGGQGAISPYCGKDATSAFASRGGTGSHSSFAYSLLSNYLIAKLGATVDVTNGNAIPTAVPTTGVFVPTPTTGQNSTTQTTGQGTLTLSLSEIAAHNTLQNCWLIVSNNVYDVTRFISQHPGGVTAITNYCGRDSTQAFQTKGGRGGNHSSYAYSLLSGYLIGSVGSSVPVNATPAPAPGGTVPTTVPNSSGLPQAILNRYPDATNRGGSYEDDGNWEGKINSGSGCREIKVNSSGSITSDKPC